MEIRIYQVNTDRDDSQIAFMPYSYAEIQGIEPYSYDMVYSGNLPAANLEEVFAILNTQPPRRLQRSQPECFGCLRGHYRWKV